MAIFGDQPGSCFGCDYWWPPSWFCVATWVTVIGVILLATLMFSFSGQIHLVTICAILIVVLLITFVSMACWLQYHYGYERICGKPNLWVSPPRKQSSLTHPLLPKSASEEFWAETPPIQVVPKTITFARLPSSDLTVAPDLEEGYPLEWIAHEEAEGR